MAYLPLEGFWGILEFGGRDLMIGLIGVLLGYLLCYLRSNIQHKKNCEDVKLLVSKVRKAEKERVKLVRTPERRRDSPVHPVTPSPRRTQPSIALDLSDRPTCRSKTFILPEDTTPCPVCLTHRNTKTGCLRRRNLFPYDDVTLYGAASHE